MKRFFIASLCVVNERPPFGSYGLPNRGRAAALKRLPTTNATKLRNHIKCEYPLEYFHLMGNSALRGFGHGLNMGPYDPAELSIHHGKLQRLPR